jgi:hypothetical protein
MKRINIEDAVGMVLGHDVTQIIPGKYKGPLNGDSCHFPICPFGKG